MPQPRKPSPLATAKFSGESGREVSGSAEMFLQKMNSTVFRYVRYWLIRDQNNCSSALLDSGLSMPLSLHPTKCQAQNVSLQPFKFHQESPPHLLSLPIRTFTSPRGERVGRGASFVVIGLILGNAPCQPVSYFCSECSRREHLHLWPMLQNIHDKLPRIRVRHFENIPPILEPPFLLRVPDFVRHPAGTLGREAKNGLLFRLP